MARIRTDKLINYLWEKGFSSGLEKSPWLDEEIAQHFVVTGKVPTDGPAKISMHRPFNRHFNCTANADVTLLKDARTGTKMSHYFFVKQKDVVAMCKVLNILPPKPWDYEN